nr:carboxypeptidase M32 [Anaerolineae bacterium]
MQNIPTRFMEILHEISDLGAAIALLDWDQQTYMPPGAAEGRGHQLATLARLRHVRLTSEELGTLLEELEQQIRGCDPDSSEARLVKVTRREYDKAQRVPTDWVAEFARVTALAHSAWEQARTTSSFALFQPHLEKIVMMRRQYADFFAPYDHVYDPLLDDFEPGLKTSEVKTIFDRLRPQQVKLIQAIGTRPQVDDSFLFQNFSEAEQWNFGVEVITRFGYDWNHGRQDTSMHPFTSSFGLDDVRITTRLSPNNLSMGLFGSMHECGHALYEQGIQGEFARTPLASGASMAIHESQSRLFENLVGRSLPFWHHFYPLLQKVFPAQLGNIDLLTFYRGINRVQPSLIRVEADEATYNLHIMLRLELEIALMEGSLTVADLPESWNSRMEAYLGIKPPDDAHGVLQDVHWSAGLMGYFPTYALGNIISAQLWQTIKRDIPDLEKQISAGKFDDLLAWLREKVHQYGAKYEPQELVQNITGQKIDPSAYLHSLEEKFGQIYEL